MATASQTPPSELDDEDDAPGFLARHRGKIALVIGLALAFGAWMLFKDQKPAKRKSEVRMVEVALPPPPTPVPTPPPPTPPPEPPPEPEKAPEFEPEAQPEEQPPEPDTPPEPADEPLGTNVEGSGDDGFGLARGGGNGFGKGLGGGGGNRSKYGWYASKVQGAVVQALRGHQATRSAALTVTVRVWADGTGRVVRATLAGSSGSAATDAAIRDQILTGLQLPEPPPAGMPMPIVMRITAKRPN